MTLISIGATIILYKANNVIILASTFFTTKYFLYHPPYTERNKFTIKSPSVQAFLTNI